MRSDIRVMSRRDLLRATIAAAGALALAGCTDLRGGEGSAELEGGDPREGAIAVSSVKPLCIDPFNAVDEAGAQICFQLFDPLMRYDYEYGVLTCLAAESYTASEDQREFTFTIREASFHNGEAVRAQDFKRGWERIANPSSAAAGVLGTSNVAFLLSLVEGYQDLREGRASGLSGITCPDDRTLVVRLSSPYADFPYVCAHHCLVPVPDDADADAEAFSRMPVGNGPYKMTEAWDGQSAQIDLSRFLDYAGTVTTIDTVRFTFYDSVDDAYRAYEAGDATLAPCPIESVDANAASWKSSDDERLRITSGRRCVLGVSPVVSYLVCNTSVAPLDDVRFRRAISLAIDREGISKRVYRDARMPADGIVAPVVPGYREGAWPYCTHDNDAAEELLDELYPAGAGGVRDVTLTITYGEDSGQRNAMEQIAESLSAVGIACELEELPFEDLYVRYRSGSFMLGRYDWSCDFASMDNVLYPLFHSASLNAYNFSRYANEQVDTCINEARSTGSEGERTSRLQEAEDIVAQDCPVIPYLFGSYAYVGNQRIEQLHIDADGFVHLGEAELAD